MKISTKLHGIIDYLVVLFLWSAPEVFQLPKITGTFTFALGGVHLLLTCFIQFEMGLIKLIPLKIHGIIELTVTFILVALAFILGDMEGELARNFYLCFAMAVFLTWLISDYGRVKNRD